ncbi:MAG: PRC-barrel domain-containing protein [Hyphomicrobiaceae bacterium]
MAGIAVLPKVAIYATVLDGTAKPIEEQIMKKLAILLSAALSLAVVNAAYVSAADQTVPEGVFFATQQPDQYLAADLLLKAKVRGADGEIFGDVEDLIMNQYNQVEGVIIGVGGFLGLGEKRIGVRYSALQFKDEGGETIVSLPEATKELIKSLDPYKRARPPKSFLQGVTERAKELAAKTSETTKDAYEKAKEKVGPALEKAQQEAGKAYNKAKEATQTAIEKATEAAKPQPQQ